MITKSRLQSNSALQNEHATYDYVDSYEGEFIDQENRIDITQIVKTFFTSGPKWIEVLFALRNKIVALFGLKVPRGTDRHAQLVQFKCEPGERIGLFKVFSKTEQEVIIGEDDRHLNFRVSIFLQRKSLQADHKTVTISTVVVFNNWFGRLYFFPVKPFHKLIVRAILKRVIKKLEGG